MPVTDDQARAIAYLAAACRPGNAPHWETPGILAAVQRVKDRKLAEVVHAFIRAAEDVTAQTPAVVTNPDYWRERSPHRENLHPPKPAEACDTCGRHERSCICDTAEKRRREAVPPTDTFRQARAQLRTPTEETA